MEEQSYANHTKWVPAYHFLCLAVVILTFGGALYNLVRALGNGNGRLDAALIAALSFSGAIVFYYSRTFPLIAQDRVILAQENLRHHVMTGKLLDNRLSKAQIIGLRFASDAEFPALAQRAADESLTPDAIKKAVKNWRVDLNRM